MNAREKEEATDLREELKRWRTLHARHCANHKNCTDAAADAGGRDDWSEHDHQLYMADCHSNGIGLCEHKISAIHRLLGTEDGQEPT